MKNLQKTKNKLTLILTTIIAVIFLLAGTSFFIFKYFQDTSKVMNSLEDSSKIIDLEGKDISAFIEKRRGDVERSTEEKQADKILSFATSLWKNIDSDINDEHKEGSVEDFLVNGKSEFPFFNKKIAAFDSSNNITYSNIENYKKIDFTQYFSSDYGYIYGDELILLKQSITNSKISVLVFDERSYSKKQMYTDIMYLLGSIFIFSLIFYLVGRSFVEYVLKPVEENIEEMNHFIDNAGHELKTPLAVIQSSSGLLKEMKHYDKELVDEITQETQRASELISGLRGLTKISKNTVSECFSLGEILKNIESSFSLRIKEKNIKCTLNLQEDFELIANKNYTYILFSNLIGNAIKYNKVSGEIKVNVQSKEVTITDTGIGIPKEEQSKIWERFYRVGKHRDREGFGLGLSMVDKIAHIYNWKIEVESIEGVGTKVIVKM